jgi:hypothetical protein
MLFSSFIGPSYEAHAFSADNEDTINLFAEKLQSPGAPARWSLCRVPGVTLVGEHTSGPGRAHFAMAGREFAVIATSLVEIDSAGTVTVRGTVAIDGNPATINSNGDAGGELFITSGGNGYIFNLGTNVLTQVAALNGKATMGAHLDGYFLALDANTSTWYFSGLLDGLTWTTGVDFVQRSAAPDPWKSFIVLGQYIILLGEQTSEVWYDAGAANNPFLRHPSGLIQNGIAASFSRAIVGKELMWLSTSREGGVNVVRMAGFTPEVVSTYPVQKAIENYTTYDDAAGDAYSEEGHTFYLLHFPTQDITWCFDSESRQWHKRGQWDAPGNMFGSTRERWHAYAFGQHRMLDSSTGAVYRMALDIHTDADGNGVRWLRRAPALVSELERVFFDSLVLDMDVGLGLTTGQGSDPQVMLRLSNDGGRTWGPELWRSAGKIGEYGKRVEWNRMGCARRRVFEVSGSDPVPVRIAGAYLTFAQQPAAAGGGGSGQEARSA